MTSLEQQIIALACAFIADEARYPSVSEIARSLNQPVWDIGPLVRRLRRTGQFPDEPRRTQFNGHVPRSQIEKLEHLQAALQQQYR